MEGGSRLIHHTAGSKLGGSEGSPKRGGGVTVCLWGGHGDVPWGAAPSPVVQLLGTL